MSKAFWAEPRCLGGGAGGLKDAQGKGETHGSLDRRQCRCCCCRCHELHEPATALTQVRTVRRGRLGAQQVQKMLAWQHAWHQSIAGSKREANVSALKRSKALPDPLDGSFEQARQQPGLDSGKASSPAELQDHWHRAAGKALSSFTSQLSDRCMTTEVDRELLACRPPALSDGPGSAASGFIRVRQTDLIRHHAGAMQSQWLQWLVKREHVTGSLAATSALILTRTEREKTTTHFRMAGGRM